jgi:hypothetical protein
VKAFDGALVFEVVLERGEAARLVRDAEPEHARRPPRRERARPGEFDGERADPRRRPPGRVGELFDARRFDVAEELQRQVKLLGPLPARADVRKRLAQFQDVFADKLSHVRAQLDRTEDPQRFVRHGSHKGTQ